MARVLVTGGAGFLGVAVAAALAERGDEAIALDVATSAPLARLAAAHPAVSAHVGEITEWARVAELLQRERPDAIVHAAAVVGVAASVSAPFRTFQVNVEGSLNLLEGMRLFGIGRMVHISSEETYGHFLEPVVDEDHPQRPVMPYGISKLAVERLGASYRDLYGVESIHLRTCWVYGPHLPRPRIPKTLVDAALAGTPLHLESGADFAVDHTHVADLVQGVLLALDKLEHAHDAYNIGSGQAPTLAEIVEIVKELVPGAELSVAPGPFTHPGGVPVVQKGALDIGRARGELGYAPRYDIRAGLADTIETLRAG